MARRDVINYYVSVQQQYLEMLADAKEYDEAVRGGFISQEQFEEVQTMIQKLKDNYDRISYIMVLLNEPNKKSKKGKYKNQNSLVYDYLSNSNDLYIKSENDDVLKKLKEIIREAKKNG